MNRQLVSFLSLFSLVLVLSVYYIMLPFSNTNSNSVIDDATVNLEEVDTTDSYFVSLELNKTSAYEALLDEQNTILASSTATIDEKAEALEQIANIKELMEKEETTVAAIKDAGYPAAYVENYGTGIRVVVYKNDATKEDAAKVMALVIEEFGMEILPEIQFYC